MGYFGIGGKIMIDLDYSSLQPLSANRVDYNKNTFAKDDEVCKTEIEKYLSNFREYLLSLKVYDTASLLIAEQDWLKRKDFSINYNKLVGRILKVDFGKVYNCENGYFHYGVCISEFDDKYLVIPMTTSNDEIKIAYHPTYRVTGEKRLYLLKKEDGNTKDAALYVNDAKFISNGRIISVGKKIKEEAFRHICNLFFEVSLPFIWSQYSELLIEKSGHDKQVALLQNLICQISKSN